MVSSKDPHQISAGYYVILLVSKLNFQVVDPSTNELCEPNQHGELCLKARTNMIGYLNRPITHDKDDVFDSEGFIRSGGIGYYDQAGTLYYVERLKEVIK